MSRTTHHRISLLALSALGLGAILVPSSAHAEGPLVMNLAKGTGGPTTENDKALKNAGPGTEQSYPAAVAMGDKTYIVTLWMSSDVTGNDRPWEIKCSSVEIDKTTGMKLVVDSKQLTKGDGNSDRPANHPVAAVDPKTKNIVWVYGSDVGSNNVHTMAGVIDAQCNELSKPIKISQDNNQNEGAPEIDVNADGTFTTGYLSGGNNVIAVGLSLIGTTLKQNFHTNVINPANIGRPVMAAMAPDRTLFCAAQGDQRPPEDGIACAVINSVTGDIVVKSKIVAASNPNQKIYMNQPQVARLDNGLYALTYVESNGGGKNSNNKGSSISHVMVLSANDAGIDVKTDKKAVAASQAHPSICSSAYGTSGERALSVISSPITGQGTPTMQMAYWDSANTAIRADKTDLWNIGFVGDSGHLANIYGQNPHTQGRDFLKCIGDVPNPGYGVAGGFMPTVKSFIVAPNSGRTPGEPKNGLWLSVIPAQTDKPAPPTDPTEVPQAGTGGGVNPTGGSTNPTGGSTDPTGGATDPTGGNTNPPPSDNPTGGDGFVQQGNGCACSVPGGESSGQGNLALVAAAGLAVAVISRRKRS
jgi:MYXO-CTERM domain-containing protein